MSWDVLFQKFPTNISSASEIPDDYMPQSIGSHSEVVAALRRIFPDLDDSNPAWILIDRKDFSIDVSLREEESCTSFMLYIRGAESAVQAVVQIAEELKLRALDCSTGDFLENAPDPAKGFKIWRSYRDQVVRDIDDVDQP